MADEPELLIRRGGDRGRFDFGWLDTRHTFSFGDYHDPEYMGFRVLRVINEDRVKGGHGFPTHPHRDMEIITYVLDGALEHKDSMGTGSVIRPGDVQRMSAGKGVTHSEKNHSPSEPVHFFQIWILPARMGIPPSYEQKAFPLEERQNRLRLVASPDGRDGSIQLNQNVELYAAVLEPKSEITHAFAEQRYGWLQVARGKVKVGDSVLEAGDGAATDSPSITLTSDEGAELLLFDLP